MRNSSREIEQRDWYARYYAESGADRNDLRTNREVLFQILASEYSFVRAFRQVATAPSDLRVLDVGCGSGAAWYQLFRLGVKPRNAFGIDIQGDRINHIVDTYPQATTVLGDASCMPFADKSFDLVCEFGIFATLHDEHIRKDIASEMIRVCKTGGYLLLSDWRIHKFWSSQYGALNKSELGRLFRVGKEFRFICVEPGSLIPPLGRLLSKYAYPLYFLIAWICPPLVGQVVYLLQKQPIAEVKS